MFRRILAVSLTFAALWASSLAAEDRPTAYRIECRLIALNADGPDQELTHPVVQTIEGQAAAVQVGQQFDVAFGDQVVAIESGVKWSMTIERMKDGRRQLDLELRMTKAPSQEDEVTQIRATAMRLIRPIPLGERFSATIKNDDGKVTHRLEMVISEVLERRENEAAVPAAQQRIFTTEEFRSLMEAWEELWLFDEPETPLPHRLHGGVI